MLWHISKKTRYLWLAGFGIVVLVSGIILSNVSTPKTQGNYAQTKVAIAPEPIIDNHGLPARLKIMSLSVDAPVTYMGINSNGQMQAPNTIYEAGWYKNGALPGNKGVAVIAGHITGLQGEPGIFSKLNKLKTKDIIIIVDSQGRNTSFEVSEIRTYDSDQDPTEVFISNDTESHLNLITCAGGWNSNKKEFNQRLVVFTNRIN